MGNVDSVPVLSQVKSAVQAAQGDLEGANQTQQRFIRQCPVVSQGTSAVQAALGDNEAALETQLVFVESLRKAVEDADGVPIASQIKSAIQAGEGDCHGAEQTQQRFIRQCPLVSQVTSAVQASMGDNEAALLTQQEFIYKLPKTAARSLVLLGAAMGSQKSNLLGLSVCMTLSNLSQEMRASLESPANAAPEICSGDIVLLKAHTGKYLQVHDEILQAISEEPRYSTFFMIEKPSSGHIMASDRIFLKAHTGKHIDVEGERVQARWDDHGCWQKLAIEKHGAGDIRAGDAVFFRAHTGKHVDVQYLYSSPQARWDDHGAWQKFTIQKVKTMSLSDFIDAQDHDQLVSLHSDSALSASTSWCVMSDSASINTETHEAVQAEYLR